MKRFRTSLAAKSAAVLLALAVGAGGFWSTVFILYQWDTLWLGSGYYDSNDYYSDLYNRSSQVHELARLLQQKEGDGSPTWTSGGWSRWRRLWLRSRPTSVLPSGATTPAPSSIPTWREPPPWRTASTPWSRRSLP